MVRGHGEAVARTVGEDRQSYDWLLLDRDTCGPRDRDVAAIGAMHHVGTLWFQLSGRHLLASQRLEAGARQAAAPLVQAQMSIRDVPRRRDAPPVVLCFGSQKS